MNTTALFSVLLAASASVASASFVYQSDFDVTTSDISGVHGLASDGTNFFFGSFESGLSVRDGSFTETTLYGNPGGFGQIRGVGYDGSTGTLLAGNYSTGDVYRMSTTGVLLDTMNLMPFSEMNAVGADSNSGNIFTLGFNGLIQQHTSTGAFVSSFNVGTTLTGLAIDDVNQSIFIMTSSDDVVHEYDYNGTLIGTVIADGSADGNGQGLYYDNTTAELYVTSQFSMTVWADSTRQVVPAPASMTLLGFAGFAAIRRRRFN